MNGILFLSDSNSASKLYSQASFLKFKFVSKDLSSKRNMLEQWQEMKEEYENNEITKETLQDWKTNYPDILKKDYLPFEESNVKFYIGGIGAKIPPDIK